jgi:IclR family transcriptional regulator, pca regulon regulatory protein
VPKRKTPADDADDALFIGSVSKAFSVLEALTKARRPLKLAEIAEDAGIGRSAAQRFTFTLRSLRYLSQDPETKAYSLTAKALEIGAAYLASNPVRRLAAPLLAAANNECLETINLTELEGNEVVYVVRYPSRHAVSVDLALGARLPAFCTAPGRAMLAFRPESFVDQVLATGELKRLTPKTEINPGRIRRIIEAVREQGFSVSDQETFVGDISTAAPVLDADGRAVAAVNIAVPYPRWSVKEVRETLTPIVVRTAKAVSAALHDASGTILAPATLSSRRGG